LLVLYPYVSKALTTEREPFMADSQQVASAFKDKIVSAVERRDVVAYYQPIVEANAGYHFEALGRIVVDSTIVEPCVFVPVLTECGLMETFDTILARAVLWQVAAWHKSGIGVSVNVNASKAALDSDAYVERLIAVTWEAHVRPSVLGVEVHEECRFTADLAMKRRLRTLRACGVTLALDDFPKCVGEDPETVLAWLAEPEFPIDTLKLDRALTLALHDPETRADIVRYVGVAHDAGMHVVAEGVEHVLQANTLRALGVDGLQGYLYGRPVPAYAAFAPFDPPGVAAYVARH
jgi:EAL domain-containing protein (putative c-di-GMP-specific phosphodiesterase class I)